jgi:hypothetical protein
MVVLKWWQRHISDFKYENMFENTFIWINFTRKIRKGLEKRPMNSKQWKIVLKVYQAYTRKMGENSYEAQSFVMYCFELLSREDKARTTCMMNNAIVEFKDYNIID